MSTKVKNISATNNITVLLAVDSSLQSESAFHWYLENIHHHGNTIVILHSLDLDSLDDDDHNGCKSPARIWDENRTRIKAIDDKYRWKLNQNGLPGKIRTEAGKPGEVITHVANEENAGLVVIGSRGLSKLKRTFIGSVSDYVLHHSKCPVLVCRSKEEMTSKK